MRFAPKRENLDFISGSGGGFPGVVLACANGGYARRDGFI